MNILYNKPPPEVRERCGPFTCSIPMCMDEISKLKLPLSIKVDKANEIKSSVFSRMFQLPPT